MTHVTRNAGVNVGVGGRGREGDGWGDLLHRLNLMLERRGIGGAAGQRRPIRGGGVDGMELETC